MNIFKMLFELFLLYLAYKLIFDFIIPVYKTTKQMKEKVSEMQQKMDQQQKHNSQTTNASKSSSTANTAVGGDYIDYEEVK
ncbi:MAG: hypothetical protein WKF35_01575 [Ferruginibacter sp.]